MPLSQRRNWRGAGFEQFVSAVRVAQNFAMEWRMLWKDLAAGFMIGAGWLCSFLTAFGKGYCGGASFGGVIALLFADLIILPLLDIYRRYDGWRMSALVSPA